MKTVTIERWHSDQRKKFWYWVVDENGEGIDGFSRKRDAIWLINNDDGLIRLNKKVRDVS